MCTQCTLYSSSVLFFCCFFCKMFMYFRFIWQIYSTGITKKELTNVEIQEQTASLAIFFRFIHQKLLIGKKSYTFNRRRGKIPPPMFLRTRSLFFTFSLSFFHPPCAAQRQQSFSSSGNKSSMLLIKDMHFRNSTQCMWTVVCSSIVLVKLKHTFELFHLKIKPFNKRKLQNLVALR